MQRYRSSYKPRSVRRYEKKSKRNIFITLGILIVLIYFLITWGLPNLIGSLSIFNKLKATPKQAVTEDIAIAPPVLNIPYEATNTAQIRISGYAAANSKVEIYLDDELKAVAETDGGGSFTTNSIDLVLGTNNIYGKTALSDTQKSLPSKLIRLTYNNEKPKLELSEPEDNKQIKGGDKKVRVSGKTDPANSVTVNGTTVIVNGDGNFSTEVSINDGDNTITVVATDPTNNQTSIEKRVNYSPS